jgi:hypothetical protein
MGGKLSRWIDSIFRECLEGTTGTRNPPDTSTAKRGRHFSLQKMKNEVTLLARVISPGYGGLAQPANSHVGNKTTLTNLQIFGGD